MSDIYFKCSCGKSLAADERGAGHTVNCVDCMELVRVPEPEIEFPCRHCGDHMLAPKSMAGKDLQCTLCGSVTKAPMAHVMSLWGTRNDTSPEKPPSFPIRPVLKTAAALLLIGAGLKFAPWTRWTHKTEANPPQSISTPITVQTTQVEPVSQKEHETFEFPSDIFPSETVGSDETIHEIAAIPEVLEQPVVTQTEIPDEPVPEKIIPDTPETESTMVAAEPALLESPAEYLRREANAIKEMRRKHRSPGKNPAVTGKIRELREEFLRYTLTHTGNDLDLAWSNAGQSILCLSSHAEWDSFEEADLAMRKAFDIVEKSEPANPVFKTRVIFYSAIMHLQAWYKSDPEKCAEWLDKAGRLAPGDKNMEESFRFFAPTFETAIIFSADAMPPEQRDAFINKRKDNLTQTLEDENISIEQRTWALWWWAAHLNGAGQAEKAAELLDQWQEKYDKQIETALFFELRMLIAAHAEGDWEKTREMVGRLRKLVEKGVIPEDDYSWNNVAEKYYRYIHFPPHDIKRQYRAMYGKGQNRI